jgi:ATP-dependent DNA helicase RecG
MKKIPLKTPLTRQILATTKERVAVLEEMGIITLQGFLEYLPRTYEDLSQVTNLSELRADEKNVLLGKFTRVWKEKGMRSRMNLTKALFEEKESGGVVECIWFNNPTVSTRLPLQKSVRISAKAKLSFGKISLQAPDFELEKQGVHLGRISPVYREHDKLKTSWFRQKMFELLDVSEHFSNVIPKEIAEKENLFSKQKAIEEIHFPKNAEDLEKAQRTLAFEKLFVLQITALLRKHEWEEQGRGKALSVPLNPELIKSFFETLPFTPTNSQKISIFEILKDFEKTVPMLRLLEGDVGAGKTLVAVAAALPIIESGAQCAFLAPTEILAQQHAKGIKNFELRIKSCRSTRHRTQSEESSREITVELLTGSIKGKKREEILEKTRKGKIDILVGTHALIEDSVIFHQLGFVVIDEQHRFGVNQREKLIEKGAPHVLQMTATPIPRTLAIVAFGDQDLSVLTELPPGRKQIITKAVPPSNRQKVEYFIESEVQKGRQVFIICPLVEESEKLEVKSATEEFVRLEQVFPKLKLALLHGRMKPKEKDEIMNDFKEKKYDILVSTAVVEVGVDVPNATIMCIEGAERFGLAQLHQFRGRVGRGAHQSYCFLFPTENPTQRLKAMENEHCGFRLAEIDLELRGSGQIYGLRQSGMPDMSIAGYSDPRIVVQARQHAEEFLEKNNVDDFMILKNAIENHKKISGT